MVQPSGIRYNSATGKISFPGASDSTNLSPLSGSRPMNRGKKGSQDRGIPFIVNFRPGSTGNIQRFHNAKTNMVSGYRPLVAMIGDSKTMGYNILGGLSYANCAAVSLTNRIADLCAIDGLTISKDSIFSNLGMSTIDIQAGYDPRLGSRTNWSYYTDVSISGNTWRALNPNLDPISFTFSGTVDRVTVWYVQRTSNQDTIELYDGATLVGSKSTIGATSALVSTTFNLPTRAANKTVSIQRTNTVAQTVSIAGIVAWDSQKPAIDLINFGRSGSKASTEWQSSASAWSPLNAIKTINADLYVINLGSNDLAGTVDVATFKTSMQNIIDACKFNGGSVILVNPTKGQQPTYGDAASQRAYSAAILQLIQSNDCPLIDEGSMFGDWSSVQSQLFSDSIHENNAGTIKRAELHAKILLAA